MHAWEVAVAVLCGKWWEEIENEEWLMVMGIKGGARPHAEE